jgi:uncharacterized protein (TIGR02217 family)
MSWIGVEFPPRIAMGTTCEPGWLVRVVTTRQGNEQRNLEWSNAKHRYDAGLAVRTAADYQVVLAHFHTARGRTHSWPLRDPLDHRCEQSAGVVQQSAGGSPQGLQLFKRYGSGAYAYDRKITRPKQGTVAVVLGGVPKTEGVDWTLDYDTGELTFNGAAPPASLAWSGQFYVPCRYDIDRLPARFIDRRPGESGDLLVQVDGITIVEVQE